MKITGTIQKILPTVTGTTKDGKEWKKLSFVVKTTDEYNNLYCFDVFGDEKVDRFLQYNKEGQSVDVEFNVKTNEWQGKYFTSLDAWKIFKTSDEEFTPEPIQYEQPNFGNPSSTTIDDEHDDSLPF